MSDDLHAKIDAMTEEQVRGLAHTLTDHGVARDGKIEELERRVAAVPTIGLRDWFAGQALVALGAILSTNKRTDGGTVKEGDLAMMAYAVARAMLAERERKP